MSDHPAVMPERAFQQVIPEIAEFLKAVHIISPPRTELRYRKQGNLYILKVWDSHWLTESRVASWELVPMPGCCGIVISMGAIVYEQYRRKGLGRILNQARCAMAQQMGYGQIMCTVTAENEHQIKILNHNGWQDIALFTNPKTRNKVRTFVKNL